MPLNDEEVSQIYEEIVSGRQAAKANAVRPMSNPKQPDVLPEIVYKDELVEVISIPVRSSTERDVYIRRRDQAWEQVSFSPVQSNDPLSFFAKPGTVEDGVRILEIAATILLSLTQDTTERIHQCLRSAFDGLNRQGAIISVDALVKRCLAKGQ